MENKTRKGIWLVVFMLFVGSVFIGNVAFCIEPTWIIIDPNVPITQNMEWTPDHYYYVPNRVYFRGLGVQLYIHPDTLVSFDEMGMLDFDDGAFLLTGRAGDSLNSVDPNDLGMFDDPIGPVWFSSETNFQYFPYLYFGPNAGKQTQINNIYMSTDWIGMWFDNFEPEKPVMTNWITGATYGIVMFGPKFPVIMNNQITNGAVGIYADTTPDPNNLEVADLYVINNTIDSMWHSGMMIYARDECPNGAEDCNELNLTPSFTAINNITTQCGIAYNCLDGDMYINVWHPGLYGNTANTNFGFPLISPVVSWAYPYISDGYRYFLDPDCDFINAGLGGVPEELIGTTVTPDGNFDDLWVDLGAHHFINSASGGYEYRSTDFDFSRSTDMGDVFWFMDCWLPIMDPNDCPDPNDLIDFDSCFRPGECVNYDPDSCYPEGTEPEDVYDPNSCFEVGECEDYDPSGCYDPNDYSDPNNYPDLPVCPDLPPCSSKPMCPEIIICPNLPPCSEKPMCPEIPECPRYSCLQFDLSYDPNSDGLDYIPQINLEDFAIIAGDWLMPGNVLTEEIEFNVPSGDLSGTVTVSATPNETTEAMYLRIGNEILGEMKYSAEGDSEFHSYNLNTRDFGNGGQRLQIVSYNYDGAIVVSPPVYRTFENSFYDVKKEFGPNGFISGFYSGMDRLEITLGDILSRTKLWSESFHQGPVNALVPDVVDCNSVYGVNYEEIDEPNEPGGASAENMMVTTAISDDAFDDWVEIVSQDFEFPHPTDPTFVKYLFIKAVMFLPDEKLTSGRRDAVFEIMAVWKSKHIRYLIFYGANANWENYWRVHRLPFLHYEYTLAHGNYLYGWWPLRKNRAFFTLFDGNVFSWLGRDTPDPDDDNILGRQEEIGHSIREIGIRGSNKMKIVFIDSCYSAHTTELAKEYGMFSTNSNDDYWEDQVLIGWEDLASAGLKAYTLYVGEFWKRLDGSSVGNVMTNLPTWHPVAHHGIWHFPIENIRISGPELIDQWVSQILLKSNP